MKIAYNHLSNLLLDKPSIEDVSKKLFQLGHEHEIEDSVFDIEFTPNRGDCLSLVGLARDLNVFYKTDINLTSYESEIPKLDLNFVNKAKDKCFAISFLQIEIEDTTDEYKDYLEDYFKDLKLNKNNFFTDISNYIAYEMGQPTHCYDFNHLNSDITLTSGISESNFQTLLGNKINIDESDLVFISNNKVINLAGIVGSMSTSCSKNTKKVLIECAHFSPESIMSKSVKYNLQSDASHKFERGVDPKSQEKVLRRFIKVIEDHAKIKEISLYKNVYHEFNELELDIDLNLINEILGIEDSEQSFKKCLSKLGFLFDKKIKVPSYRNDITHQNDLAEEFARVIGYDNITKKSFRTSLKTAKIHSPEENLRLFLIDNGFSEVINYPFSNKGESMSFKLDNPLDSNKKFLRNNLIDSLLSNLIYNEKRQKDSLKLFEISDIYLNDLDISDRKLSIIVSGRQGHNFHEFNKLLDKKYLDKIFTKQGLNLKDDIFEISREKLDTKLKTKIFGLEISINKLNQNFINYKRLSMPRDNYVQYKSISEFPSSSRDLSFSIEDNSKIIEVINSLENLKIENLKDFFMFDYYENKDTNITKIGYRFIFQSFKKTLTDNEINNQIKVITDSILSIRSVSIPGIKD